jgi:hypothetical protein
MALPEPSMSDSPNIVQVHLGREIPPHLFLQLEQTRVFNPNVPIFLILSAGTDVDYSVIEALDLVIVRKEGLARCANHRRFLRRNRLNRKWMDGFWLYTSERFYAIESFLEACGLRHVIHLENDVMLYMDLERYLPAFRRACPHVGLTMDSDNRCVPGILYFRDRESLCVMNDFVVRNALRTTKNDMGALAQFMNRAPAGSCSALPVIPPVYRQLHALANREGESGKNAWYDEAYATFEGVFDAAALGQFLGGIEPRISTGDTRGFINETAVYDPRNLGIFWKSEAGLRRPFGTVDGVEFPIFNLHVHSKRLEDFSSVGNDVSRVDAVR